MNPKYKIVRDGTGMYYLKEQYSSTDPNFYVNFVTYGFWGTYRYKSRFLWRVRRWKKKFTERFIESFHREQLEKQLTEVE